LKTWVSESGASFGYFVDASDESADDYGYCEVLTRLKILGLLQEGLREKFLDAVRETLDRNLDATALDDDFSDLMS
jgi:hypothetical protein